MASQAIRTPVRFVVAAAGLLPALLVALLAALEPLPVRAVRDLVFDSYQRLWPRDYDPATPVRVVAIDDESLARIGRWPWPRATLADLTERLTQAGAAAIAFDVIFSETEAGMGEEGDAALLAAIARGPVVLGFAGAERGSVAAMKAGFATQGDDPRRFLPALPGALLPLPGLREAAQGLGALNFLPDRDLVVREVPLVLTVGGALAPSLALEALRVAQGARSILVRATNASGETSFGGPPGVTALRVGALTAPTGAQGNIRIHYAGTRAERQVPAWRVLAPDFDAASVAGAIVLVGATATAIPDFKATPLEPTVPGIDIHAEALESLLQGERLTRPDWFRGLEIASIVAAGLIAAAAAALLPALGAALVAQILVVLAIAGSVYAFRATDTLFDPVGVALAALASSAAAFVIVSRHTDREKKRIREAFSRYVSPAIVEALARNPGKLALGGETKVLTVMFSDIRGFTSRSESLSATEVVAFLNEIHAPLTEHVLATGGTLDKFMGDGMMAFWNAPLDHPDHVRAALRCALAMQETVEELNRQLRGDAPADAPGLAIGIGIHTGPACVGNIGSHRRFDYSAIGDTVNAAARIEPLCKQYGVPIIVSADIAAAAPDFAMLFVDSVRLRGRQQETRLYALVGGPEARTPEFEAFKARHDAAVTRASEHEGEASAALDALAGDPRGQAMRTLYGVHRDRIGGGRGARVVSASA